MKEIDTPTAVQDYTGIPVGTLSKWRYQNRGPSFLRAGRMIRYRRADVDKWLEANAVGTKDQPANAAA